MVVYLPGLRPLLRLPSFSFGFLCFFTVVLLFTRQSSSQFRDVSKDTGFEGGGKVAFADFDNDGFVDFHNGKLFRNISGKKFIPVEDSGLPGGSGVWGDYDNDGFVDFFQFSGKGGLYRNTGARQFERVDFPDLPTVNSLGAVWADINNDGYLDLYVGGYEIWERAVHPDAIFLNQRDGSFKEHWRSPKDAHFSARGVSAADLNEDGAIDVFVSNYRLQPNFLWQNDGKGVFTNKATELNAAGIPDAGQIIYTGGIKYKTCGHTIGSALGDLDDDGHIDILVGNFSHPRPGQDRPQFLENLGPKHRFKFNDRSADAKLAWQESFASAALGDYDNDGDLDLYFTTVYGVGSGGIRNYPVLYRNEGNWKFTNVTGAEKIPNLGSTYQAAWADVDNDGDLDLCTDGKLFLNDRRKGNWIQVVLMGDGERVNASAIGAIARIRIGDRVLTRHVETGTGEGNHARLHFGLGQFEQPVNLEVTWPGKRIQQVDGLDVNKLYRIEFQPNDS